MSLTSISPHIIERITALYKVSAGGVVDRRQILAATDCLSM